NASRPPADAPMTMTLRRWPLALKKLVPARAVPFLARTPPPPPTALQPLAVPPGQRPGPPPPPQQTLHHRPPAAHRGPPAAHQRAQQRGHCLGGVHGGPGAMLQITLLGHEQLRQRVQVPDAARELEMAAQSQPAHLDDTSTVRTRHSGQDIFTVEGDDTRE